MAGLKREVEQADAFAHQAKATTLLTQNEFYRRLPLKTRVPPLPADERGFTSPRGLASPPPKLCGPISESVGLCGRLAGRFAARPYLRSPPKAPACASTSL